MASIGINIARDGSTPLAVIQGLNVSWVRVVALDGTDLSGYFRTLKDAGLKILLVLARESGGDYAGWARRYAGLVDAVEVGNEPDLDSPSSWTMTPVELASLGRAVRGVFPRPFPLVVGGLASGHPEWLDGAELSWADAIGIHPYLRDAPNPNDLEDLPDVDALVRAYQRFGLPLLVTEWGWWDDQEPRASEETRDMVAWAAQTSDVAVFCWFCASDQMVPPFGLLDRNGRDKPRAPIFRAGAARAVNSPWPSVQAPPAPPPPGPDPWQWWTPEQASTATGANLAHVREHWPHIAAQLVLVGIYDRLTAIAAFATVVVEVGARFEPIHEYGTPADWARYSGGAAYAGRGYIQLTHDYNYRAYTAKLAALWGTGAPDLYANPDFALDPDVAGAVLAMYFADHNIPALAAAGNWAGVRRAVNGGMNGWQTFADAVEALKAISQPAPPPVDDRDQKIAAYELALRTLRDSTLPALRAQLDEAERICVQFVGPAA